MNLMTAGEVEIVRNEMLWRLLCHCESGTITDPERITNRLANMEEELSRLTSLHWRAGVFRPELSRLFGNTFYHHFVEKRSVDGHTIKEYLKRNLSTRRFSDEQIREHLEHTSTLTSLDRSNLMLELMGKLYHKVPLAAVVQLREDGECQPYWPETFQAPPPIVEPGKLQGNDKDRIRELTLAVGQSYFRSPHLNRAQTILAEGSKPHYRTLHGLDHALRTQMAIGFLLDDHVLPKFHRPSKELLHKQPQLRELLPIAELYQDAVAEDEPKELRAAELFQRDMSSLQQYPNELIDLVARA
ncbi:hypothetical protein, partial [Thalassotalea sp. G20_0]|uniref:hypothetical protein n=1 Tax=Thalassotalea sp. G20_0 TaxID=2821093 RepID=UPI001AD9A46E